MSLSAATRRVSYAGNGSTTAFSFPYKFFANADIVVVLRVDSTGVETTKTITTHYTVTGAGESAGGTVTMVTAPATGETLTLYADPALAQGLDLTENDSLPAESLEAQLDKVVIMVQRLKDRVDRTVRLTDGYSASFDPKLPALLTASAVVKVNSGATAFEMGPTVATIEAAATEAANAASSASSAATSATNAASSASAAASSASAAAASASGAAAQLASAFFRDVVYKTSADSPVTISSSDNGKMFVFDSSGGAIAVTLPQISGLTAPFNIGALLKTAGNNVTFSRSGTDTIMGATTKVLSIVNTGAQFVLDADGSPDDWSVLDFGSVGDGAITSAKLSTTAVTGHSEDATPDTESDYAITYDASAAALKKVKLNRFVQSVYRVVGADCKNNAGTPNTQFDLDCDAVTLIDSNYNAITRMNPGAAITNNISTAGSVANGRDQSGAFSAGSWVHFYWIWNGATLATLSSATAPPTGPTLPSGYTHWAYAGAVWFVGGALRKVRIKGCWVYNEVKDALLNSGTATVETALSLSSYIPPNALVFQLWAYLFTTTTASNIDVSASLRVVTGSEFSSFVVRGNTSAAAYETQSVLVPNIGQSVSYLLSTATDAPGLSLAVQGYKVPNGGE